MATWGSSMVDSLRISTIILGLSNLTVVIVGGVFAVFPGCDVDRITIPVVMVSLAAAFKIFAMFNSGIAQKATAITILDLLLILLLLTPLISFEDGWFLVGQTPQLIMDEKTVQAFDS